MWVTVLLHTCAKWLIYILNAAFVLAQEAILFSFMYFFKDDSKMFLNSYILYTNCQRYVKNIIKINVVIYKYQIALHSNVYSGGLEGLQWSKMSILH